MAAHLAGNGTARINVGLACKQGVRGRHLPQRGGSRPGHLRRRHHRVTTRPSGVSRAPAKGPRHAGRYSVPLAAGLGLIEATMSRNPPEDPRRRLRLSHPTNARYSGCAPGSALGCGGLICAHAARQRLVLLGVRRFYRPSFQFGRAGRSKGSIRRAPTGSPAEPPDGKHRGEGREDL